MRTAVVSDIHANFQALGAVADAIAAHGVDRTVCLGDIVGYGADPAPCLAWVREHVAFAIAGNHDRAAVGLEPVEFMNDVAAAAIRWTGSRLGDEDAAFLSGLAFTAEEGAVLFVHGSPEDPEEFHYIFNATEAALAIGHTTADVTFVGHSHRAFVFSEASGEVLSGSGRVAGLDDDRYLVNVGSVGQPRDGDPRSAFAVYDDAKAEVEIVRVAYDVEAASARILEEGLPPMLASRLVFGH